jgi:hypothetical protein
VVDGSETLFPILKGLPERFFLIKPAEPGGAVEVISVNGQLNPVVDIRPGEMQFWRGTRLDRHLPARRSDPHGYVAVLGTFRKRADAQAIMRRVNAAVVGLLGAALYDPV